MIKSFTTYILESRERRYIDELEVLTPDELGNLLTSEVVNKASPDVQFIQDLLYVGCPIDHRDKDGWTALHYAALYGYIRAVDLLLSKGADIHAKNDKGYTAWDVAHGEIRQDIPELNPNT